jgi:peroxiredoxin 2/4
LPYAAGGDYGRLIIALRVRFVYARKLPIDLPASVKLDCEAQGMLKPGDITDDFDLPAVRSQVVAPLSLSRLKANLIVLFFYVRDFSFICPTEVVGFQKLLKEFTGHGAEVIGVSVDSVDTHLAWARELGGVDFPLVADESGKLARAFGVFDEREKVALRATFILNANHEVLFCCACQANIGRGVEEILRSVEALASGRLCPADWRPETEAAP